MTPYDDNFYLEQREKSYESAKIIFGHLLNITSPTSIVDVGCGVGVWLKAAMESGVNDITGIDGSYVNKNLLAIPEDKFVPMDLTLPFSLGRTFDLAISMEVAEHLPEKNAESFIGYLTSLAPMVLFSAAIPKQGGTNHLNEQWQDYWANVFAQHNFLPIDCIRPRIWDNLKVDWWYSQNCILFARKDNIFNTKVLADLLDKTNIKQLSIVHPQSYLHALKCATISNMIKSRIKRLYDTLMVNS